MQRPADVFRSVIRSALIGAAIGLPVLGVGGRVIMRVIALRNSLFLAICVAFTWHAVNVLLPRPRLTFVALTVVYVIAMEILAPSRTREAASLSGAQAIE